MGSEYVDGGPSLGSALSGVFGQFTAAPGKALDNMAKADAIAKERALWQLNKEAADKLDAAIPQASVAPSTKLVPGPWSLDDPNTLEPRPGSSVMPAQQTTFIDPQALAAAQSRRAYLLATGRAGVQADPKYGPAALGYGTVGATGIPTDPYKRAEIEFYTTGRLPNHIGPDEAQQPYKNWVKVDENNQPIPGSAVTSKLQPPGYVLSSPVSAEVANPIKNQADAQNGFFNLSQKMMNNPEKFTREDVVAALKLRDAGWPKEVSLIDDPTTGQKIPSIIQKTPPPTEGPAGKLMELLTQYSGGPPPPAAAAPPPAAAVAPPPAAGVNPTFSALRPGSAASIAAAAAPAPIVPAPAAGPAPLATVGAPVTAGKAEPVLANYKAQPVVHNYEMAKSGYTGFIKNLPMNNQTSDLALIVGASKILDPPSVVREGEVENVRKTGGIMDKYIGQLQALKGEGRLPLEVRMQLWNMVHAEMEGLTDNVRPVYEQHAVQLSQRQLDPATYLPPMIPLVPVDMKYVNTRTGRSDNPATEIETVTVPNTGAPTRAVRGGGSRVLTPDEILERDKARGGPSTN